MRAVERIVVDTNVLVSAILAPGSVPKQWVSWCLEHAELVFTDETETEFLEVVSRDKFNRFAPAQARMAAALAIIGSSARAQVSHMVQACRDARDDKFLDAALASRASLLVSGDKDLLALHPFEGIAIVTPAKALALRQAT
ncbi:MAG: putative toxin-antitoxin system toxin component, PIN family [Proteobacteria bacterium]|nr:putative toxin-antitoxin system toxin component, PIN family [Pseudomonadota bacterium]